MEFGNSSLLSSTKQFPAYFSIKQQTRTTAKLIRSPLRLLLHHTKPKPYFCLKATREQNNIPNEKLMEKDLGYSRLTALSPLDGRYWGKVEQLALYTSQYSLIYYLVLVQVQWMLKLFEKPEVGEVPSFSNDVRSFLVGIVDGFSEDDALEIKTIDTVTSHAIESFLKKKCETQPEIAKVLEFFHFDRTSEDIKNLAHGLMVKASLDVIIPAMDDLIKEIYNMAKANAHIPMLSRTHGQPASPTTLGKEMSIFAVRLSREWKCISQIEIKGNFGGAADTYPSAYPSSNWPKIAEEFVTSLGLSFNSNPSQIDTRDYMSKLFDAIYRFNNVLVDFDRDIWGYISMGYFKQITKTGEIGSSTMPHKVNPIDFENSEGNLGIANAMLSLLSNKLLFQVDLTDAIVLRNMGSGLGHALLGYKNALQGIGKLQVNADCLREDLDKYWEVLAEPIQTVMRRYGVPEPYEKLKELTRGKATTKESINKFIEHLEIPKEAKMELLLLTPHCYVGEAVELASNSDKACLGFFDN